MSAVGSINAGLPQLNTGFLQSPDIWGFHLRLHRACCDKLLLSVAYGFSFACRFSVIDYCSTRILTAIDQVALKILNQSICSESALKSQSRMRRLEEVEKLRKGVGEASVYARFSKVTAEYIGEVIPRVVGERFSSVPCQVENLLLYRSGLSVRYLNHQLDKQYSYRKAFIDSEYAKDLGSLLGGLQTYIADYLVGKNSLESFVNWETLLLSLSKKAKEAQGGNSENVAAKAVRSLAASLKWQEVIGTYISTLSLKSEEEGFIARLEWHKKKGSLPLGLPDPGRVSLTVSNLQQSLDESLAGYIEDKVAAFLERFSPAALKSGLLGVVYTLEGKDLLVKALSYLIAEFGYKQLADPHLFALAILYSGGMEVAAYEVDGFGRGKKELILKTGREMVAESLRPESTFRAIVALFERSGLRKAAGGLEEILQKKEAKELLRKHVASLIYEKFKEEDFRHDGRFKGVREKASRMPLVGMATVSLHLVVNGMFYSLGYVFRKESQSDTSFISWMFKHFSGKDLYQFLANKIVDLIYHPSWRITLLQLVQDIMEPANDKNIYLEDFKQVTEFMFRHLTKDSQLPFDAEVAAYCNRYVTQETLATFKEYLKPSQTPLTEKLLEAFLPTLNELRLYGRVLDMYRRQCVSFAGDAKFWEVFIRESLNEMVVQESWQKTVAREEIVRRLLEYDELKLKGCLSFAQKTLPAKVDWNYL